MSNKNRINRMLALLVALALTLGLVPGSYLAASTTEDTTQYTGITTSSEIIEEMNPLYVTTPSALATANGVFTYTVNIIGYSGEASPAGFSLFNLDTNASMDGINFTQGATNWWSATFTSTDARLNLRLDNGGNRRSAFYANNSFVLTPDFHNVFIFWEDMVSTLYATPRAGGLVDFTIVSWDGQVSIAGDFTGWGDAPVMATIVNDNTLATLTPVNGVVNPNRRVQQATIETGVGSHEFKIIRQGIGWSGGENALLTVPDLDADGEWITLTLNYYQHPPRNYDRWNVWLWVMEPVSAAGSAFDFRSTTIDGNPWRTVDIRLPVDTTRVGFIVRLGTWEAENPNIQFYLNTDGNGRPINTTIYYIHGEHRYHRQVPYIGAGVQSAMADWHNYIRMTMNFIPGRDAPGAFDWRQLSLYNATVSQWVPIRGARQDYGRGLNGAVIPIFHVDLDNNALNPQHHYRMYYGDQPIPADVVMRHILDQFHYRGWLGLEYSPSASTFKVWAPTATNVQIAIYDTLDQTLNGSHFDANGSVRQEFLVNPSRLYPMTRNDQGVWSGTISSNLAGRWYMYRIEHSNGNVEFAIDPNVTAVSANGQLGAIITREQRGAPLRDADGRNRLQRGEFLPGFSAPEIRRNQYGGTHQVDHVIYELHVRDFSIHPSSGMVNRGLYTAFTETGTTVNGIPGNPSTGIDHLVELGITTVHLLPVYDQQTLNELSPNRLQYNYIDGFNWGYDPQNFNVPEGSYSADPTDPALRIRELKALIDALHERGIRVVKDVVYNHTYSILDGPFHRTVPGYYYRSWCNGLFSNGSGVGNEVASERPMVRQYIIDSLLFWQEEFGFDGFRFDLMWLHDHETMYQAVHYLRSVDPDVLIYGEPWRAAASPLEHRNLFGSHLHEASRRGYVGPTDKYTISGQGFGFFNDDSREIFRGNNDGPGRGFITGATHRFGRNQRIEDGLWNAIRSDYPHVWWASESINYVSKHDNLILWDNISWSLGSSWGGIDAPSLVNERIDNAQFRDDPHRHINRNDPLSSNAVRSLLLGTGIVLTSQGVPFLHAGDEFLRTKHGHRNSFNAPDFYNAINWELKIEFYEVFEFYRGLIELRNNTPAFRMDMRHGMDRYYHRISAPERVVAYRLGEYAGGGNWRNIFVAYNGSPNYQRVYFGHLGNLNIVVNDRQAGIDTIGVLREREAAVLPPFTMFVAFDIDNMQ